MPIFALTKIGHVAQLNSAPDYGSGGCWFESSRGHFKTQIALYKAFAFFYGYKS